MAGGGQPTRGALTRWAAVLAVLAMAAITNGVVPADRAEAVGERARAEPPAPVVPLARQGDQAAAPGELLVRSDAPAPIEPAGTDDLGPVGATGYRRLDTGQRSVAAVADELEGDQRVVDVEPNHRRYAMGAQPTGRIPNDPLGQESLDNSYTLAWGVHVGSDAVTVAVLDTGVDREHEDLVGRVLPGWDFVDGDADPDDGNGHGTMVAGVIAANSDNAKGAIGIAWRGRILPVRVLDDLGRGSDATVAAGVTWAADRGVDVINLSLGGPRRSPVLERAVRYAAQKGVVVVAAAGNEASAVPQYPAAFADVVAVGAQADFSSRGGWLDLVAPATLIGPRNRSYATGTGTSFSSAVTAGVVMLVRAKYPSWTQAQVVDRLRSTANDIGRPGPDAHYGAGVLHPWAALGGPPTFNAGTAPSDDPNEPNDSFGQAVPLPSGPTVQLEPGGDVDWFAKDISAPGRYEFMVTSVRGRSLTMVVHGPDGRVLGSARDGYLGQSIRDLPGALSSEERARAVIQVTAAGRHRIEVRSDDTGDHVSLASVTVRPTSEAPSTPTSFGRLQFYGQGDPDQHSSAVADVTGDGRKDVVVLMVGRLDVFERAADGYLDRTASVALPTARLIDLGFDTGDIDGDGRTDVVVPTEPGLQVLYQRGGRLAAPVLVALPAPSYQAEIADLDGDGRQDLVAGTASQVVITDPERPGGTYVARSVGTTFAVRRVSEIAGEDVEAADLTGDGRVDIATGDWRTFGVGLLVQDDGGGFTWRPSVDTPHDDVRAIEIADLDGDGQLEVVATGGGNRPEAYFQVFRADRRGDLRSARVVLVTDDPEALRIADINGDGRRDVVTGSGGWGFGVSLQRSDGSFTSAQGFSTSGGGSWSASPDALALGDVDGNGRTDLVSVAPSALMVLPQRSAPAPTGSVPWVLDTTPGVFAFRQPATVHPTVRFGRAMQATTINAQTVQLRNSRTRATVPASVTYDPATRTAVIKPVAPLPVDAYRIDVSTAVRDAAGVSPAAPLRFAFRRYTPGLEPATPTGVRAVASADGSVLVSWAPGVRSGAMRPSAFTVQAIPEGPVETVSGSATSTRITGLWPGRRYTFTVLPAGPAGRGLESAQSNAVVPGTTSTVDLESYVRRVYRDLLGRQPDAAGLAYWVGRLRSGAKRAAVSSALANTDEYRARLIVRSYATYLGRLPDGSATSYWLRLFRNGATLEQLDASLMSSGEYYVDHRSEDLFFVQAVIDDVLGRATTQSELDGMLALLANGASRNQIVRSIVLGDEGLGRRVDGFYRALLGRPSDATGRRHWANAIRRGGRDEQIVASIIASDEYFRRR